jgi:carbamoyl-phosphate synthase small subunit
MFMPDRPAAQASRNAWLASDEVPAVYGIDTRTLTRRLREHGTMRGWLVSDTMSLEEAQRAAASVDMTSEVFHTVAPNAPIECELLAHSHYNVLPSP